MFGRKKNQKALRQEDGYDKENQIPILKMQYL